MSNKAKIRERAKMLNPIDDIMFHKMAESKEFCEELLQVILEDKKLEVIECRVQYSGKNLQGRSVILDAYCKLGDGSFVDVEVQKADDDDHQKRVRYNGAILTTNITDPGLKFEKVPSVCVVFISRFDVFKSEKACYHVDRVVRETGEVVDNGFSEIYVNAKVSDGSEISELMKIFVEDSAYNFEKFPKTSKRKQTFKVDEKGVQTMCEIMEQLAKEERAEGRQEGELTMLINLVKKGLLSVTDAAKEANMTIEEFETIAGDEK